MSNYFDDFKTVDASQWMDKISHDLKGKVINDALHYCDDIENIPYQAYQFSLKTTPQTPGEMPYTRGGKSTTNAWSIVNEINLNTPEEMNKKSLSLLMKGAEALIIDFSSFSLAQCDQVIQGIGFEYIKATLICHTQEQFDWAHNKLAAINTHLLTIVYDNKLHDSEGIRNLIVDASSAQKVGANNSQEIAYALHKGHELLVQAMETGLTIDQAVAKIKFNFGIGSNYYFEIAKFRAFRTLWASLVSAYNPSHTCSCLPYVSAETGSLNKSLKDPDTNLLRQTTEAMSAIIAGVNELLIRPYNWRSKEKKVDRSQRFATNIGLILREESYLDKVIDPAGGSYAIEDVTVELESASWKLFQELENVGIDMLREEISIVTKKRVQQIEEKKTTLIGVNKYFNSGLAHIESWDKPFENELGKELILERDCKIVE